MAGGVAEGSDLTALDPESGRPESLPRLSRLLYVVSAPRISTQGMAQTSGPARHILGVVGGLRRQGVNVDLWLSSDLRHNHRAAGTSEQGLRGSIVKRLAQDLARVLFGILNMVALARQETPPVLYERLATLQMLGIVHQRRGALWVVESNGIFFREAKAERGSLVLVRLARAMELACYKRADLVVAVSNALREQIIDLTGVPPERVVVIRNGVDSEVFPETVARDADSTRVGFVGTLIEWQGVDRLIHALTEAPLADTDVELHIIGDGPAKEGLVRLARDLDVPAVFHGRCDASQIPIMLSSWSVGFCGHTMGSGSNYHSPLKLYEYAACGVSVVTTASEDAAALQGHYPITVLPEPWTDLALAQALRNFLMAPRPRPLRITYDERVQELVKQLEHRLAR